MIVATIGVDNVIDIVTGWFNGGTEILGKGDYELMVEASTRTLLEGRTARLINTRLAWEF